MIPKHNFGLTGHTSIRIFFGAYALSKATQTEADRILELLLESGVNHIDTAPMYGNAEKRIGPWMEKHRTEFFLATKSRKRTYQRAWDDLNRSLDRLRVDHVDLWQMHGLTDATNPDSFKERAIRFALGLLGVPSEHPLILYRSANQLGFSWRGRSHYRR